MLLYRCRLRDLDGYKKFRDECMLSPQDALKLQAANGERMQQIEFECRKYRSQMLCALVVPIRQPDRTSM